MYTTHGTAPSQAWTVSLHLTSLHRGYFVTGPIQVLMPDSHSASAYPCTLKRGAQGLHGQTGQPWPRCSVYSQPISISFPPNSRQIPSGISFEYGGPKPAGAMKKTGIQAWPPYPAALQEWSCRAALHGVSPLSSCPRRYAAPEGHHTDYIGGSRGRGQRGDPLKGK